MLREILNFILHLRLHYQFFILSGGYLLGGLLANQMNTGEYWLQFLNVHILLFGGATAFNSYWDKDTGPVGGLKHPPEMKPWMHKLSLLMLGVGWVWAYDTGLQFAAVYGISAVLFWLYSTPLARWKGHPHLSLLAIALSTGVNSVFLGLLAAGGAISGLDLLGAAGAGLILLSLYPVSQVYQIGEDKARGDNTFAVLYGLNGVKNFFAGLFITGLILLSAGLFTLYQIPTLVLFVSGSVTYGVLLYLIFNLKGVEDEYQKVMNIKFFASLSFVLFLFIANSIRYGWISAPFLQEYF